MHRMHCLCSVSGGNNQAELSEPRKGPKGAEQKQLAAMLAHNAELEARVQFANTKLAEAKCNKDALGVAVAPAKSDASKVAPERKAPKATRKEPLVAAGVR